MGKQIELPQGALEMLILKSISLGSLHGYGSCFASSKSLESVWRYCKARSTPLFIALSAAVGLEANGASPKITAAPNTTTSPLPENAS